MSAVAFVWNVGQWLATVRGQPSLSVTSLLSGQAVKMKNVCPYHGVTVAAFRMTVLHLMSQETDVVNRRQTC